MGYGVIAEYGGEYLLWVPHHSSYGEIRTDTIDMKGLYNEDVSIHTAIAIVDTYETGIADNHSMGIMGYVEDGAYVDFGGTPSNWPTYVYSSHLTFYRVAFHVSLNGGYVKGSHFCQFWGDPAEQGGRRDPKPTIQAWIVYDNDNLVRHVHRTLTLDGPDVGDYPDADPIDLAKQLGHTVELHSQEIDPLQLTGRFRLFDPATNQVVPEEQAGS